VWIKPAVDAKDLHDRLSDEKQPDARLIPTCAGLAASHPRNGSPQDDVRTESNDVIAILLSDSVNAATMAGEIRECDPSRR